MARFDVPLGDRPMCGCRFTGWRFSALTIPARLAASGARGLMDDQGVIEASPQKLKDACFRYEADLDMVSVTEEIVRAGIWHVFERDGKTYWWDPSLLLDECRFDLALVDECRLAWLRVECPPPPDELIDRALPPWQAAEYRAQVARLSAGWRKRLGEYLSTREVMA